MVVIAHELSSHKDFVEGTDIICYKNIPCIDLEKIISPKNLHSQISVLKLEFCDMSLHQIEVLSKLLLDNKSILEVSVNGNPNTAQNFYLLLHGTNIIALSLKFCCIDATGIEKISNELYTPHESNLLHLNLSSNSIETEGVEHIVRFLRINRTLISLNLADNKISDMGCIELMGPLQKFVLNFEETVIRRRIKFDIQRENMNNRHSEVAFKSNSVSETSKFIISKETSVSKLDILTHPFMEDDCGDEDIYCKGNDILINLNLSYNKIKERGLSSVIKMLYYQRNYYAYDRGISRISTEGNDFNNNNCNEKILCKVNEILTVKSKRSSTGSRHKNHLNLRKRC